ncbi:2-hydroxycarboxylate transporter family protein [Burkholderia dolosa]|uniref:2-hydroxycarboxylate transporter family protein n=1 Tax=Burkholderia dolosa TaxID=152500 RepID=UPI0015924272|nr:2-hydroxycarboxylate transporter family protein [Burkholderia dolosa]MBR8314620.1 2-hydroxycarboxylate transporter family protein [Burkholderia dolosa]MBR8455914.1 2-hydroxycarboxylate transporter family protein [Burkholderia dolosa]MBY4753247.1 2-hydroxycarboxylate transporter family protein [Burkholderia dolosa]MBY4832446.1 2-hydroxycarboxylate transporter family protein [Burkholderia dolosa]MDN7420637.1 2-hydroxycarboxylate transporter family protein [Burkholderia dolosa]
MQTSIHTPSHPEPLAEAGPATRERFWPAGWWKLMEIRIGIIPLPVYVILLGLIVGFAVTGKVPGEISMAIAVLAFFGFTCAELGKRLPILRNIGAAAIFATFVPSALTYYHVLPKPVLNLTVEFTKSTNFLYLFIASIIVGSILSMDRRVLIQGFLKIFVPLAVGTIAAAIVGTAVGTALGLGARHTLLYIVVPIMAGGVGEGAIPLSIGYSELLHLPQGEMFAMVLPSVMLGSLTAIILSGALDMLGKRLPHLTGNGRLQVGEAGDMTPESDELRGHVDVTHIAGAGITAITLYLVGLMAHKLFGLPAPVAMLFLAVLVKLARAVSPPLQEGAFVVYKFFSTAVTYPLLFAIGVAMTPWDKLTAAFTLVNVVTIVATVATLMGTGFVVGRLMKMYPIDTAIVNACHSGQGGTGDVAILTAANRMQLMPFAQIATRIGGAIVVTVTLILVAHFG